MTTSETSNPVELIPPRPQTLWGPAAVANFVLGGLGAGLYAVAVGFAPPAVVALASWLAPALVLAGFAAVATEAGRPLRGPRVLARARTSWMSRELWIGTAFVVVAAGGAWLRVPAHRELAVLLALALALAQGFILRRARGVTAWDVPVMPSVFVLSALVSGAGAVMILEAVTTRSPGGALPGSTLVLLVVGALVWLTFVTWSREEVFVRATRLLREGPAAIAIVGVGYLAPFVLLALGLALPELGTPAFALAGLAMVAGQAVAKAALILRAGQLRPITLEMLRLERRLS